MPLPTERIYTVEDIYALPNGQRAELIDGQIYMIAPPSTTHQRVSYAIARKISDFIDQNHSSCEVFPAPFVVFLEDNQNYVEPDISVICDKNKINEKGCNGAPDWIIEIVSPSSQPMDYGIKLFKYRNAGVREYWIVNPERRTATIYDFEQEKETKQYSFDDTITVCIYNDLQINIANLLP